MTTLGALLAERRRLVGRDAELEACVAARRRRAAVAVVHGVAGSGKSALLRAFGARRERGATHVGRRPRDRADARRASSPPRRARPPTRRSAASVIDTAERLRLLDGWLRTTYLPSLPAHARVVIATRDAPGAVWRAAFGELLRAVAARPALPRRRRRAAARPGPRRGAGRAGQPLRARPPAVAAARGVGVHERPDATEERCCRPSPRSSPRSTSTGSTRDPRGARRDLHPAPRHALAARRAARRRPPQDAFARLRGAAVRRARPRGPGRPRHRPRGGRGAAARHRPGAPPRLPHRRVAADPRERAAAAAAGPRWRT